MKVLLIYPYCIDDRLYAEDVGFVPMGLYYVGALLKENHYDVEILNWHNINKTPGRIEEILGDKRPDVIGFSILHANRWGGIEISRIAREINPEVKCVFGGIGATFLWRHFLTRFQEIDFVVLGEGEYSFLNLIKCIEKEDYGNLERIKGIAFRKNGKPIKNAPSEIIQDLDALPDPARYFTFQHVSSTRGCPGNCSFCGSPAFWGRRVRFYSKNYFVNQLAKLKKKGVHFFFFSDDTFTINKDRVIEICKEIIKRDLRITWAAISKVNYVDDEVLEWMRKAGCVQISYGVESGSDTIRNKVLKKNITRDQIKKAFESTTSYGMMARAYFIYGSPGESWATIQKTIDLIHEIKPLSIIFYILDIFPGTALYQKFIKKSGLSDDIWLQRIEDIMYFETDPRLNQELIRAFGERLRTNYYESLGDFADSIELIKKSGFSKMHSDFLSRLAMTFSHGDYARIESIKEKERIAERLYEKALAYHPDRRAYLGLGIIRQKKGDDKASIAILTEGLEHFPGSDQLSLCLGISLMNVGEYEKAIRSFRTARDSKEALQFMAICYRELGQPDKEAACLQKIQFHSGKNL